MEEQKRSLGCKTCCGYRSGTPAGTPCNVTQGCPGIVEELPFFHELVDELPEPMTCGRRMMEFGPWERKEGLDRWQKFKSNGDRVCSFCGSLHPEDFFRLVGVAAAAPATGHLREHVSIEPSTKSYKIYVHQPGVRNGHEGGMKFYTHHLPRDGESRILVTPEQNEGYKKAVTIGNQRLNALMQQRRGGDEARPAGTEGEG